MIETIIVLSLATFAISLVITTEHGPFGLLSWWRDWLESGLDPLPNQPDSGAPAEAWANWQAYTQEVQRDRLLSIRGTIFSIFNCPICLGLYVSLALALVYSGIAYQSIFLWLASYGGHLFLLRISERG